MTKREVDDARRYCGSCPVIRDCLVYALQTDQRFGIWGGFTQEERKRIQEQFGSLDGALSQLSTGALHEAVVRL